MKEIKDNSCNNFKKFLRENKQKIREISNFNTTKNDKGIIVIKKDNEWRNENEWDELYEDLKVDECYCR